MHFALIADGMCRFITAGEKSKGRKKRKGELQSGVKKGKRERGAW